MSLRTNCEIGESSILINTIEICSYWDSDGEWHYAFKVDGDIREVQITGLLELVKFACLGYGDWGNTSEPEAQ